MELKNYNVYFFLSLLVAVSVVAFFIFQPFLIAILVAAILSVIFRPVYDYLQLKLGKRKGWSALLTTLLSLLVILIPFSIILTLVVSEISSMYVHLSSGGNFYENNIAPLAKYIEKTDVFGIFGLADVINKEAFSNAAAQIGQFSISFLQSVYQSMMHFLFMVFVVFFSMYYFLVHGKDLMKKIMMLSPLKDSHESLLIEKFVSMSRATIRGTIIVSFVQGMLGGAVFAIVGIPSATIWAVFMMLLSLIPMFGSSIIWFPAGLIMLFNGRIWEGVFILSFGLLVISLIDNFLRPELVGKDTQMHPLIVFFATLGGIALFGFVGFILGPIIVALFLSMWDIYAVEFRSQLKNFNS